MKVINEHNPAHPSGFSDVSAEVYSKKLPRGYSNGR